MDSVDYAILGMLAAVTFVIALLAMGLVALVDAQRRRQARLFLGNEADAIIFLFDDEFLVNATDEARQILESAPRGGSDWQRFLTLFLPRFPALKTDMGKLADDELLTFVSVNEDTTLRAEWKAGLARLTLIDHETTDQLVGLDKHSLAAMEREIESLRGTAEHAPFLVWREMADGTITWANNSYLELSDQLSDAQVPIWPPNRLFDLPKSGSAKGPRRVQMAQSDGKTARWFECHKASLGDETLYTAIPADGQVKAENDLRDFVQTLTKTFAALPEGLAIFDKNRQLALFNPALTDLTTLPVDFLIMRPTLASFLDRLREKKMIPEPKDYMAWRHQIAALEAAATGATYEDTWHLATGQIYRVTGRPHPDGALAFLIEDISAEVSLTRRFRAELDTGQAVIDSLDEAIAVFSADGTLTMTNAAYATLWGDDHESAPQDFNVFEASRIWHSKCAPSPVWAEMRDYATSFSKRAEWNAEARLWDGRRLHCRARPLAGGATLIGFAPQTRTLGAAPPAQPPAPAVLHGG